MSAATLSTSRCSTPTTTSTRRRTRSPSTCPTATRAPSTTSTCGAARRSSCAGRSATTSPTPPSTSWPGPARRRTTSATATPRARAAARSSASRCGPSRRSASRRPRLELMDEQGIDRALMFPTLASLVEERMRDDPELIHAVIHALNEWMHETWQFDYEGRIFATPVITLPIVEKAIEELEWVVERGARVVLIRPAPVPGFRGLALVRAPGVRPVLGEGRRARHPRRHALAPTAATSATPTTGWAATARCSRSSRRRSACCRSGARSRTRSAALICHGALSRFPQLKVAVIENGSSWVEPLLKNFKRPLQEDAAGLPRGSGRGHEAQHLRQPVLGGGPRRARRPHRRRPRAVRLRLPAPRGARRSGQLRAASSRALPEETVRKIMGGNLARLMNVEDAVVR